MNKPVRVPTNTEAQIFELSAKGIATSQVLDVLLPNGDPLPYETDLWDYKLGFSKAAPSTEELEYSICGIVKDIAAFFNTFGGYLVLAFPAPGSQFEKWLLDYDLIQQKIERYAGRKIFVRYYVETRTVSQTPTKLLLIQIPRRPVREQACHFKKPSAVSATGRKHFEQNQICARRGSESMVANNDPGLLQFITGERPYLFVGQELSISECDHNLPPRDPNILQFIGRQEYLHQLWAWLADALDPIRLLTAIGGTGKTSIAYEFCEHIIQSGQSYFDKIIWMTGKSKTYAAILGKHISTTRTDFTNIDSFLTSVLLELAMTEDELKELSGPGEKEEYLHLMVRDSKIFLIVDDVDSLDLTQQQELYALINRVFYKAVGAGSQSKCLLTSRLELYAGATQIVRVKGFPEDEARQYSDVVAEYLSLSQPQRQLVKANFGTLYVASSQGSPIFIASILLLFSLGDDFLKTVEEWKGKEGDLVRRSAFEHEIKSLSYSGKRTLYAMQLMAETTFDELRDILDIDKQTLRTDLGKLRQFHLFVGSDDPATGAGLTVPEPIRLMFEITEVFLQEDDAKDIKKKAAQKTGKLAHVDPIRTETRRVAQLMTAGRIDDAEVVARAAVAKFPKNGDVACLLGKVLWKKKPPMLREADKYFNEARFKKCTRPELLHHWVNVKYKLGDEDGLLQITNPNGNIECRGVPNVYRLIILFRRGKNAENREDYVDAIEQYANVVREGVEIVTDGRADAAYMIISKLMNGCANYAVANSITLHGQTRNSLRTAEICVEMLQLGIWSKYILAAYVRALDTWWEAVERGFQKDEAAVKVVKKMTSTCNKALRALGLANSDLLSDHDSIHVERVEQTNGRVIRRVKEYARSRGISMS
jgi:hypothetical protein